MSLIPIFHRCFTHEDVAEIDESLKQSVFVILLTGDNCLVMTRSPAHGVKLHVPGGKVETGEEPVAALRREVREELGIDLDPEKLMQMGRYHHDVGGGYQATYFFYTEEVPSNLKPGAELRSVLYVPAPHVRMASGYSFTLAARSAQSILKKVEVMRCL